MKDCCVSLDHLPPSFFHRYISHYDLNVPHNASLQTVMEAVKRHFENDLEIDNQATGEEFVLYFYFTLRFRLSFDACFMDLSVIRYVFDIKTGRSGTIRESSGRLRVFPSRSRTESAMATHDRVTRTTRKSREEAQISRKGKKKGARIIDTTICSRLSSGQF